MVPHLVPFQPTFFIAFLEDFSLEDSKMYLLSADLKRA